MNWNKLEHIDQLGLIEEESKDKKVLLFKHSSRCGISLRALDRLERNWKEEDGAKIKPYIIDVLQCRGVSNEIAAKYNVIHESPQVLVIDHGKCIYHESQSEIGYDKIMQSAKD